MKKMIILASVLLVAGLFTTGCTSMGSVAKELKDDHATVDVVIRSPWGNQEFHRSNPAPVYVTNGVAVAPVPTSEAELVKALRALPATK